MQYCCTKNITTCFVLENFKMTCKSLSIKIIIPKICISYTLGHTNLYDLYFTITYFSICKMCSLSALETTSLITMILTLLQATLLEKTKIVQHVPNDKNSDPKEKQILLVFLLSTLAFSFPDLSHKND